MKCLFVVAAPLVLLAGPALASQHQDVLNASLVSATRHKMSVAPWVDIAVTEAVRGDKLVWVADTGGGQRYVCTAPANADAVLTRQVSCGRLGAVAKKLASRNARPFVVSVRNQLPYPGQYPEFFSHSLPTPTPFR